MKISLRNRTGENGGFMRVEVFVFELIKLFIGIRNDEVRQCKRKYTEQNRTNNVGNDEAVKTYATIEKRDDFVPARELGCEPNY